jgi:hypothetical protein
MSVSGRSEITTAAAWIDALRTMPSRPRATSTICLAVARLQALLEARRAAHDRVRDQLRQPVSDAVVVAQDARGVARGRAGEHLAERDDLGHAVAAVLVGHVADHAVAAAHREVDVDVRHRHALGVEEPLEQEVVAQRVDVRDLQAVGHEAAGRAAAPRPDRDAVLLGEANEVPDDQEVGVEAHVVDDPELHLHALDRLGGRWIAVAAAQPLLHQLTQVRPFVLGVGALEARDQVLAELDLDIAALRDLQRGGDGAGHVGERLRHLLRGLQEELVRLEGQLRLRERGLGLHAQQRRMVVVVLAPQVVHVGRRDEGAAHLVGEARDRLVDLLLLLEAVALDLEVHVLGPEDLHELVEMRARLLELALHDALAGTRGQAPGEADHAVGVPREQLEVHPRLAAMQALEEAGAGELHQVA